MIFQTDIEHKLMKNTKCDYFTIKHDVSFYFITRQRFIDRKCVRTP